MTLIARQCKVKFFRNQFAFISLTYSITMLIDRGRAFMVLEADVSLTGGNVQILHLELDYFCICTFSAKSFPGTKLDQFEKG